MPPRRRNIAIASAGCQDARSAPLPFIACGRADTWPVPQGQSVVVLGAGCRIAVPGLLSTGQIVWRVPPTPGRLLTDAPQLHAALLAVLGPRPEAQR